MITKSQRGVALIGAPTDVGASDRGASMGPEALRVAGIQRALASRGVMVSDLGNLSGPGNPSLPHVQGYRHLSEVVAWNQLVHDAVAIDRLVLNGRPALRRCTSGRHVSKPSSCPQSPTSRHMWVVSRKSHFLP